MADRTKLGARYHFEWEVERGKIGELAAAIGDPNPVYRDIEAARKNGYQDIVASPTFTTVPPLWSGTIFKAFDDLGIPLSRILHAGQTYEYFGEIHPGDTLKGVLEIKSITERQGKSGAMEFVLFETTYTNQHDLTVLRDEMLIVERK